MKGTYKRDQDVHIRMTPSEKKALLEYSKRSGLSITEIVCRGVETYISQRTKNGIGICKHDL